MSFIFLLLLFVTSFNQGDFLLPSVMERGVYLALIFSKLSHIAIDGGNATFKGENLRLLNILMINYPSL